jgi:hypothetical protein
VNTFNGQCKLELRKVTGADATKCVRLNVANMPLDSRILVVNRRRRKH